MFKELLRDIMRKTVYKVTFPEYRNRRTEYFTADELTLVTEFGFGMESFEVATIKWEDFIDGER